MKDEILEELWRIKDQITSETKGNTQALFDRLRTDPKRLAVAKMQEIVD